jgi:ubiquinone/menaquinone biosynthesis C-methylase UbiE
MNTTIHNLLEKEIDPAFARRAKIIFEEVEKYKPKRILDVGCGRGFYLYALSLFSFSKEIHGVDINETYIKKAQAICKDAKIHIEKANVYKLPFPSSYFDFIICSEVLEHIPDDRRALMEIKRVLKRKGKLLITVPNLNFPFLWDPLNWVLMKVFHTHINKSVWWLAGIWADHVRLYTETELRHKTTRGGFKNPRLSRLTHFCFPFSHFLLYGLGKNIVEIGFCGSFNRFGKKNNKSILLNLALNLFRIFDAQNRKAEILEKDSAVNILVTSEK